MGSDFLNSRSDHGLTCLCARLQGENVRKIDEGGFCSNCMLYYCCFCECSPEGKDTVPLSSAR